MLWKVTNYCSRRYLPIAIPTYNSRNYLLIGVEGKLTTNCSTYLLVWYVNDLNRFPLAFRKSPTVTYRIRLKIVEEPKKPIVLDAEGSAVMGTIGPFRYYLVPTLDIVLVDVRM